MEIERTRDALSRRVLVVEDDRSVRELLLELLLEEGHVVRAAADGHQALAVARELRPDVILLDMRLARAYARDFLDAYRAEFRGDGAAVIVMSGLTDLHAIPGADAVLSKPFTIDEVLSALETRHLDGRDAASPGAAPT